MPRRLSNFKMAISRVALSAFLLIVFCYVAKADPVVPVGTVLGGDHHSVQSNSASY